ncbi:hypothetical protein TRAPUB_10806 [Trametes pubescens]|uniref:F-box domain-containing protein n=1 Tax=Trametes pubescens TaxID=154538 RepID=A0A1M2VYM1_TRAPU|nr:hypothetical protein TRAPUB_10806 [Trametes pubescens]
MIERWLAAFHHNNNPLQEHIHTCTPLLEPSSLTAIAAEGLPPLPRISPFESSGRRQEISINISTSTMGQYWHFFNVNRLEQADPEGGYKLGSIFYTKQPFLVRSLTIPYPVPELAGYLANTLPLGPIAKKGMLSLPDELLDMILDHDDLPILDRVCLAITCKKLLILAEGSLLKSCRTYGSAGWAHCQIACLGDYATLDSVPERLLPPAQKDRILKSLKAKDLSPEDACCYAGLSGISTEPDQYCGVHDLRSFVERLPMPDRRLFVAALAVTFPARDDWALCNTTKREYVRAGALAELSGQPDDVQPFLMASTVDLGTALFTRFCFSPDDSIAMVNTSVKIHEGKWVGDRVAINTLERMKLGQSEQEWKDVTDEVIADIKDIYQDEFDEDWEKKLTEIQGLCDSWYFQWDDAYELGALLPSPEEQRRDELLQEMLREM